MSKISTTAIKQNPFGNCNYSAIFLFQYEFPFKEAPVLCTDFFYIVFFSSIIFSNFPIHNIVRPVDMHTNVPAFYEHCGDCNATTLSNMSLCAHQAFAAGRAKKWVLIATRTSPSSLPHFAENIVCWPYVWFLGTFNIISVFVYPRILYMMECDVRFIAEAHRKHIFTAHIHI